MERQEWLEQRRQGIGGSDAASVFNVGYGCRRRLCYDKRGIEPDFPRESSLVMELGNLFEPWLAKEYLRKSEPKRFISESASRQHPVYPEARVNPDRLIFREETQLRTFEQDGTVDPAAGVLEIKAQGRGAFSKTKRVGMPEDYILQLNHAMWVTGTEWGSFQVGNRDSGESTSWDVNADKTLFSELEKEVPKLWSLIQSDAALPDRLDVEDHRCSSCGWRVTCQGNALVHVTGESDLIAAEDIRPLLVEYDQRKPLFDEANALMEETKEALKLALTERPSVRVGWGKKDRKVYFRGQDGRVSWNGAEMAKRYERLRAQHPDFGSVPAFDQEFPPAETFRQQGVPFRALRVY